MGLPSGCLPRTLAIGHAPKAELSVANDDEIAIEVPIFPHVDDRESMRPGVGPVAHEVGVGRAQDRRHVSHLLLPLIDGADPAE